MALSTSSIICNSGETPPKASEPSVPVLPGRRTKRQLDARANQDREDGVRELVQRPADVVQALDDLGVVAVLGLYEELGDHVNEANDRHSRV